MLIQWYTHMLCEYANQSWLASLATILKVERHLVVVNVKLQYVVPRKLDHLWLKHTQLITSPPTIIECEHLSARRLTNWVNIPTLHQRTVCEASKVLPKPQLIPKYLNELISDSVALSNAQVKAARPVCHTVCLFTPKLTQQYQLYWQWQIFVNNWPTVALKCRMPRNWSCDL